MSVTYVTSEALQQKIRELLPSQTGFGDDLSASNTILPIIDLTSAAEGSGLPSYLQQALGHTDITHTETSNGTDDIITNAGFWLVNCNYVIRTSAAQQQVSIQISDGATSKFLFRSQIEDTGSERTAISGDVSFVVISQAGDTTSQTSSSVNSTINTTVRQLATLNGTLINPTGYTPA